MANPTTPTAVFMMGGPGAGKSYVRKREYPTLPVVDCDMFKAAHPDYDPSNPAALHAWSSQQCTKEFFRRLSGDDSFVYDGTGTNAEKMVDWMLKAQSAGFRVELVYVSCPLHTALRRNRERERFVPEHIVREKHEVVDTAFMICRGYADSVRVIENG
jgi:predicted kinase